MLEMHCLGPLQGKNGNGKNIHLDGWIVEAIFIVTHLGKYSVYLVNFSQQVTLTQHKGPYLNDLKRTV